MHAHACRHRPLTWWLAVAMVPLFICAAGLVVPVNGLFGIRSDDVGIQAAHRLSSTLASVSREMPFLMRAPLDKFTEAADSWVERVTGSAESIAQDAASKLAATARETADALRSAQHDLSGDAKEIASELISAFDDLSNDLADMAGAHFDRALLRFDAIDKHITQLHASLQAGAMHVRTVVYIAGLFVAALGGCAVTFVTASYSKRGRTFSILVSVVPALVLAAALLLRTDVGPAELAAVVVVSAACVVMAVGQTAVAVAVVLAAVVVPAFPSSGFCSSNLLVMEPATWSVCRAQPKLTSSCPVVHQLFAKASDGGYIPVEAGFDALEALPGPLYILSELGPTNTGKSLRQTMTALLLTLGRACEAPRFGVRQLSKSEAYYGHTRGITFVAFPVADIVISALPEPLQPVIRRLAMTPSAAIVLIDTEGSDDTGQQASALRRLQLVTLGISSAVSISTRTHVGVNDLRSLGSFAHLMLLVDHTLAGMANCRVGTDFELQPDSISTALVSRPELFILPMVTDNLLASIPGVSLRTMPSKAVTMDANATLDMTTVFWEAVEQQRQDLPDTVDAITRAFRGSASYFANVPPFDGLSSWLRWACPSNELGPYSLQPPHLPRCWQCGDWCGNGVTFGYSTHILPHILLSDAKVVATASHGRQQGGLQRSVASGKQVADLALRLHRLDLGSSLDFVWTKTSVDDVIETAFTEMENVILQYMRELEAEEPARVLPIEPSDAKKRCSRVDPVTGKYCLGEDFQAWWAEKSQRVHDFVCSVQSITPAAAFEERFQSLATKLNLTQAVADLRAMNDGQCVFNWRAIPSDSACQGSCPGYRGQKVDCVNIHGRGRPEGCCDGQPKPGDLVPCDH